jgi:hypothetical protein
MCKMFKGMKEIVTNAMQSRLDPYTSRAQRTEVEEYNDVSIPRSS